MVTLEEVTKALEILNRAKRGSYLLKLYWDGSGYIFNYANNYDFHQFSSIKELYAIITDIITPKKEYVVIYSVDGKDFGAGCPNTFEDAKKSAERIKAMYPTMKFIEIKKLVDAEEK